VEQLPDMSASPRGAGWTNPAEALATNIGASGGDVLLRLAEHDPGAIVDLYQLFGAPLFSYAIRILGDHSDAEEVLQDMLVKAWEKSNQYDPSKSRPFTWCCTLLRGLCFDKLRRRNATKRGNGKTVSIETENIAAQLDYTTRDAREHAIWHEQIERVRQALETLHPLERTYIKAAIFQGSTHNEIAENGGEPIGTVKSRIRRGMIKLRQILRSQRPPAP
jgi:RNA polymerase sigma-70 factor (ECF subfamily)